MFERILGGKRLFPTSARAPFFDFSLFGDPAQFFRALPTEADQAWVLDSADPMHLRLAVGMAWLNHRPMAILTHDPTTTQRAHEMLTDAAARIASDTPAEKPPGGAAFPELLTHWRRELDAFYEGLNHLQGLCFGPMNGVEVAVMALRLHPAEGALPFLRIEREAFRWQHEEYRQLSQLLENRTGAYEARAGELLRRFGLDPLRISEMPKEAFVEECTQLRKKLHNHTRTFERDAHALRPRYQMRQPDEEQSGYYYRMNLQALADLLPEADTLLHWRRAFRLWEQEMMGYGWMPHFKGLQAISLEDIHRDLLQLLDDLELLAQWAEPLWYAAVHWRRKNETPLRERKLLAAAARLNDHERGDTFTYWYLYHWLQHNVDIHLWAQLKTSDTRHHLAKDILPAAIQWYHSGLPRRKKGVHPTPPTWTLVQADQVASLPPDTLRIYWMCGELAPANAFHWQPFDDARLPVEYMGLQQTFEQNDAGSPEALPFPYTEPYTLWDARSLLHAQVIPNRVLGNV